MPSSTTMRQSGNRRFKSCRDDPLRPRADLLADVAEACGAKAGRLHLQACAGRVYHGTYPTHPKPSTTANTYCRGIRTPAISSISWLASATPEPSSP